MSIAGKSRWRMSLVAVLLAGGIGFCGPVSAETLQQALVSAYEGNPTLRAERARQRATDEQVPQALSGWRPTVTVQGDADYTWQGVNPPGAGYSNSEGDAQALSIELAQPIFRGFKTINGTRAAEANVEAGRQNLLAVEQEVLFDGVQAYMDVLRDRQIVELRRKNVSVLDEQLRAANERFSVGEVTRTDVAQARARLSQSQANLAGARAALATSAAEYVRVVGHEPGKLGYPKAARLPKSIDAAYAEAAEINPNILAAALIEEASTYTVEVVKGDLLPEVSLLASGAVTNDNLINRSSDSASIAGVVTIPLYEAGRVYSSVREAKQVASQRRIEVIEAGRAVRAAVATAWNSLVAARQTITAAKEQVSAASLALEGVRQEYLVGSRTTLDVLDAEAELVDARVALVSAERDQIVASYQVLGSIGRLTARNLALNVDYYDPAGNYGDVRDKWIGTGANTVE